MKWVQSSIRLKPDLTLPPVKNPLVLTDWKRGKNTKKWPQNFHCKNPWDRASHFPPVCGHYTQYIQIITLIFNYQNLFHLALIHAIVYFQIKPMQRDCYIITLLYDQVSNTYKCLYARTRPGLQTYTAKAALCHVGETFGALEKGATVAIIGTSN